MANDKKVIKAKPLFLIQAEAFVDQKFKDAKSIEDPKYGPGLTAFDHKVFIGVMDLQMNHVNDVLVKGFGDMVAEHYKPIMAGIENIEKKIKEHDIAIEKLKRVYELPINIDSRITKLETYASIKWTIVRWLVAIVIALSLATALILWRENKHLSQNTIPKPSSGLDWGLDYQMKVKNANVRSGHIIDYSKLTNLTKKQQDSIHDAGITANQQGIERQIEERNKSSKQ